MGKIQKMSEQLANMIAAGEVIERPASVVKELLENAIDASSTSVEVHLLDSGVRQIKVIDNGDGMSAADAVLAFERHATSKVKTQYDIFRIQTLGFRGEALPSIASVSDVHVRTSAGVEAGAHVHIKGGDMLANEPGLMRKGTEMEVNHLFFNTPARLKHIKSLNTELSHITDYINKVALSHPNIAFKLFNNQRLLFQSNGQNNLQSVIANVYGFDVAKKMIPIAAKNGDYEISGYVSDPIINRASRNYMTFIVNGRAIRNYNLTRAVVDAYHTLMPKDKYPVVVLNIKLDPMLVDVNVHPAKLEVRFSQEEALKTFMMTELQKVLHQVEYIPIAPIKAAPLEPAEKATQQSIEFNTPVQREVEVSPVVRPMNREISAPTPLKLYEPQVQKDDLVISDVSVKHTKPLEMVAMVQKEEVVKPIPVTDVPQVVQVDSIPAREIVELKTETEVQRRDEVLETPKFEAPLEKNLEINAPTKAEGHQLLLYYIGQLHGTYLLAQNEEGLFIVDQHAAMERVQYEKNYRKLSAVSRDSVELLVPIMVPYTLNEMIKLRPSFKSLLEWGFEVEEFGQNSIVVRSIPTWAQNEDIQQIVETIMQQILFDNQFNVGKLRESVAITMSCKGSIKANQYINEAEIKQLLHDLCQCVQPYTCPHGRPITVKLTKYEIEKLFKRVM